MRYIPLLVLLFCIGCKNDLKVMVAASDTSWYNEAHRPQIHFSPKEKWMNDPNGMVFFNNTYHMFYQYYPDSTVWGPMHWGHATSTDLVHWEHKPIALYPDSLGYIFSGSAVVDSNNTSGFGKDGKIPLVAIFTHHEPNGEKNGSVTYQNQSIAYSLDEGNTWTKHVNNPVLKNPGIKDFRDPKVFWHSASNKWIMSLATLDRISFYSSPDLKSWTKESEFGATVGAHGGVWECPDLFPLMHEGKQVWVLFVSINPGGPNGGSATQYFTGDFDGKTFKPYQTDTRWLDHGPDDYAGVTFSNTGDKRIFIGWMGNWQYAQKVPTKNWRSAMTIPRELSLEKISDRYYVRSWPSPALEVLRGKEQKLTNKETTDLDLTSSFGQLNGPAQLHIKGEQLQDLRITLSNTDGQQVIIGYDQKNNRYYMDRTASGKKDFEPGFAAVHTAPRIATSTALDILLVIDNASVEMFADNGSTVMTQIFFPDKNYSSIKVSAPQKLKLSSVTYHPLRSIYAGK